MSFDLSKYNPLFKKDIVNIYHSWININKPLYIKYYNLIALILMALLVPIDYILYPDTNEFSTYRIVYILIVMFNLLFIQLNQKKIFQAKERYELDYNLLLPGLLYNLLYIFYLILVQETESYMMVLLANFITIIATTMFAMKFWKEQYSINIISMLCVLVFYIATQDVLGTLCLFGCHIILFFTAYFYRRSFIVSMYDKYCTTASMVPKNVAKHIAVTDSNVDLSKIFKPTKRFTICLSSDWRNFQKIASNNDPVYIEKLFQNFYDIVFEELDRIFPNGNYYADWTADEIFIIFYSENENNESIMKKALEFSFLYATSIFDKINSNLSTELIYDIGLASGVGLLGLQGPEKLKKTTITGESAGTAKRFETEAKEYRKSSSVNKPNLIVDEKLYIQSQTLSYLEFDKIKGSVKDIENLDIYIRKQ